MKQILLFVVLSFLLYPNQRTISQVTFTDVAPTFGMNDPGNGQGAVFLDVNNDGYLDLFLDNNGSANKLWINNGGTSFTEMSAAYGVNYSGPGRGVSGADFNNDGLIDIMIGNYNSPLKLYKNNNGSFIDFTSAAGINITAWGGSINWFDYNSDGKVDAMYANDGVPYHYNYLFQNQDLSTFINVAFASGLVDSTSTLCIATADYDNDGDLDIFCGTQTYTSPTGTSFVYRNNGNGTFTDVTTASGIVNAFYTWGADWGDYNNDGYMDLYLANYTGMNQLYKNNGDGTFTEIAVSVGLNDAGQSYSCGWGDYDNDGDLDLYVAKGMNYQDKLYRNDTGNFTDVSSLAGMTDTRHSACISWGDYNNDGFLDLYLVNNGSENRLYKSNAGNSNKWLILKMVGVQSNRSAIGARVRLKTGNLWQMREVQGGSGGKGQNSLPLEFGLGSASVIDSIVIRWPSGLVQGFAGITPNQILTAVEGENLIGLRNPSSTALEYKLEQNYPNPFNPNTKIQFSIPRDEFVSLIVFDILGREVKELTAREMKAGLYEIDFDSSSLSSGIYFYTLKAGNFTGTKKMVLVK
jgi:hypothetical protein